MSGASDSPGALLLAIKDRKKGGSYDDESEGSDKDSSASYESEGQSLMDALDKEDAAAVGAALHKMVMRCMADEGE